MKYCTKARNSMAIVSGNELFYKCIKFRAYSLEMKHFMKAWNLRAIVLGHEVFYKSVKFKGYSHWK